MDEVSKIQYQHGLRQLSNCVKLHLQYLFHLYSTSHAACSHFLVLTPENEINQKFIIFFLFLLCDDANGNINTVI